MGVLERLGTKCNLSAGSAPAEELTLNQMSVSVVALGPEWLGSVARWTLSIAIYQWPLAAYNGRLDDIFQ